MTSSVIVLLIIVTCLFIIVTSVVIYMIVRQAEHKDDYKLIDMKSCSFETEDTCSFVKPFRSNENNDWVSCKWNKKCESVYSKDNLNRLQIFYINLKHRDDRNKQILSQFTDYMINNDQVTRVEAVYNKNGATGCNASHVKALEMAKNYFNKYKNKFLFIVEDDFVWRSGAPGNSIERLVSTLMSLEDNDPGWGVLLLSCNSNNEIMPSDRGYVTLKEADRLCQTASGYVINANYIDILYTMWNDNLKLRMDSNFKQQSHDAMAIDQVWKSIQHDGKWYVASPLMGKQQAGYSDIEKVNVNYESMEKYTV